MLTTHNIKPNKPAMASGKSSIGLWVGLVITLLAQAAHAEHKDPAPLSDEVIQYMYKALNVGANDPFLTKVDRMLDETTILVGRAAKLSPVENSIHRTETASLLRSKSAEFKGLRAEWVARLAQFPSKPAPTKTSTTRSGSAQISNPSVTERFDRITAALDRLANATPQTYQAALANMQKVLQDLRSRNQPHLDANPGLVPTWTLAEPTKVKPEDLPRAPAPKYVASNRRAPGNNVYAFLGNTLLAAMPDPVQPGVCDHNGADLGESIEVKLTPEIRALAEKLGYSPAKIYEYVNKEFAYEPYAGSLKGATGTLIAKGGNATDQASLLIALLRASQIPARYVRGEIQFTNDPRGLQWIGAKDYAGAKSILARGGIAAGYDGVAKKLWFDHVWVEACVPYGNYRGTKIDRTGHRWIPLDPSFKEKTYQAGIITNVEFKYADYLKFRLNGPDSLPHEAYAKQVEENIKTLPPNYENNTIEDVPYKGRLQTRSYDILPASLPYHVNYFTAWGGISEAETPEVPDSHRYKMEISGANLPGTTKLVMPEIALSRVTLAFSPTTGSDQAAFNTYLDTGALPGAVPSGGSYGYYLPYGGVINANAVLRVDGAIKATGSPFNIINQSQLTLVGLSLNIKVTVGGTVFNQTSFSGKINPRDIYALFADAFVGSDRLLRERSERLLNSVRNTSDPNTNIDETIGEFLHIVGLKYMRYSREATKRIGSLGGSSGELGNGIGATSTVAKAQYLFDLPYGLSNAGSFKGLLVDFPGVVSRDADLVTGKGNYKSFILGGYALSALESYVWQENARMDAVSTVSGIQFANEKDIEVLNLDASNWATEKIKLTTNSDSSLNYSLTTVAQLEGYISQGFKLTIPRSLIFYDNWKGAVWVQEKESTSGWSAGYIISGGYAGGYATRLMNNWWTPPPVNTDISALLGLLSGSGFNYTNISYSQSFQNVLAPQISSLVGFGNAPNNTMSNDPVNMVTGNMYHTERDIAIKGRGGLPIVLERSYNSRDTRDTRDGPLGFGWTHSFNQLLSFEDDDQNGQVEAHDSDVTTSTATWIDGTGARKFIKVAGNSAGVPVNSVFTAPKGFYFTTTRNADGTYTIVEKNGLAYRFETIPGTVGQKARLIKITDRNDNSLTLSYASIPNCNGTYVCTVTDSLSRSLTFAYDGANRIQEIKDWTGRQFQYAYDGIGNLISFKNPLAVSGAQQPVKYDYYTSDPQLLHAMKRYTLPRGNGMTFEYYTNGKVFKHFTDAGETATFTYNEFRRESIVTNERGHTRRFFFDANANLVQLVEENGAKRDYKYDINDPSRRLSKRDPEGYLTEYEYDSKGNVTKITNPSFTTVTMSDFNDFNQPGKVKDARGNYTLLKYDLKGNLTQEIALRTGIGATINPVTDSPSPGDIRAWIIHTYDSAGNRTTTKRVRDFATKVGPIFTYDYDTNKLNVVNYKRQGNKDGDGGLESTETSPLLVYDGLGRPTTDTAGNWYPVTKVYDSVDRITRMSDALGNLRDYKYDANGNPIEQSLMISGAFIDQASAQYDTSDRKTTSLDVAGNVTAYQYDAVGNVVKINNPDNYSLSFDYNEANQVVKAYDQEGHAVTKTLDLSGKPRSITDPNGNSILYEYYGSEKDGRLKQTTDPAGRKTVFDYDANGNAIMVKLVPSDGSPERVTLTDYDELNRPIRNVGPVTTDLVLGTYRAVTKNTYDNLGNLVAVAAGRTDITGMGADVNLKTQVTYTWDDFGRKIKEADPLGKFWQFEYDIHNNLTKSTDAKGQATQFTYSSRGLLLTRTDAAGNKTTYTYNALGQVLTAQNSEVTYSHAYDKAHRIASITDSRGGKKINYAYSPGGLLNTMTYNEGRRTDYLYDPVGRLSGIWAPNDDYVAYVYDAAGRLTEKWFPNGVNAQYIWNNDNTLAQVKNRFNHSDTFVVSQHDYTYNGVGQRKDALDKLGIYTPPATNETYGYDELGNRVRSTGAGNLFYITDDANQLLEVRSGSNAGPITQAYVYDDNGNLTQKCEGGTVTRTSTTCTGANVTTLTYNALDQLAQVSKPGQLSQYAYDDAGRRIKKTVNGATVHYLYNGPDIQAEYQSWSQANVSYTHGPNMDDPAIRVNAANDANYFHQDGLGSVVGTTDQSGNLTAAQLYDAWGKPTSGTGGLGQYGYTGREPDETGMMYYRARYYDPSIGRFISRDPAGMPDGVNRYGYVAGDPMNAVDPQGEVLNFLAGAGVNVIVGGAIRMATGGDFWDAKAIAFDAAIGGATSGVGALVQMRNVYRAANTLRAEGRIVGAAQRTGQASQSVTTKISGLSHEYASTHKAVRAAQADPAATVYLNRAYSTATGVKTVPTRLPDVGIMSGGKYNAIEIASKTDDMASLYARNQVAMGQLPAGMRGSVDAIETVSLFGTKFAKPPATELSYLMGSLGALNGTQAGINSYFSSSSGSSGAGAQTINAFIGGLPIKP